MFGKIGELLSDEESVKQLTELAQLLMTDSSSGGNEEEETQGSDSSDNSGEESESPLLSGFDFSSLMKLQGIMGAMRHNDKNTELLIALKPHLKEAKHERVDKAIKILKLLAVWNIIKDSGLLKDFL